MAESEMMTGRPSGPRMLGSIPSYANGMNATRMDIATDTPRFPPANIWVRSLRFNQLSVLSQKREISQIYSPSGEYTHIKSI